MTETTPQDFILCVSFDLLHYDKNQNSLTNHEFQQFIDSVSLPLDLKKIDKYYFEQPVGTGDFFIFTISDNEFIFFDLYKGVDDQCDIIMLGARLDASNLLHGKNAMRSIYDNAQFMLSYEQGSKLNKIDEIIKASNYPKEIYGYNQQIHLNCSLFLAD